MGLLNKQIVSAGGFRVTVLMVLIVAVAWFVFFRKRGG
jgi:hypothetical protein